MLMEELLHSHLWIHRDLMLSLCSQDGESRCMAAMVGRLSHLLKVSLHGTLFLRYDQHQSPESFAR